MVCLNISSKTKNCVARQQWCSKNFAEHTQIDSALLDKKNHLTWHHIIKPCSISEQWKYKLLFHWLIIFFSVWKTIMKRTSGSITVKIKEESHLGTFFQCHIRTEESFNNLKFLCYLIWLIWALFHYVFLNHLYQKGKENSSGNICNFKFLIFIWFKILNVIKFL